MSHASTFHSVNNQTFVFFFCANMSVSALRNVIHGSDSVESAQKEIPLWFRQNELHCWEDGSSHWIYN